MIIRKITVCLIVFLSLLIGGALTDRHFSRDHYTEPMSSTPAPQYNLNTINAKETDKGRVPFSPREYIRIIRPVD